VACCAYVGVGASVSLWHWWQLAAEQRRLAAQIALVRRETRVLRGDLRALRDPAELRAMLEGRRDLPSAVVTPPTTLP
jgi:hypothetical protein